MNEPFVVGLLKAFYRVPLWLLKKAGLITGTVVVMLTGAIAAVLVFLLIFLPDMGWTTGVLGFLAGFVVIVGYYYTIVYLMDKTTIFDWLDDKRPPVGGID